MDINVRANEVVFCRYYDRYEGTAKSILFQVRSVVTDAQNACVDPVEKVLQAYRSGSPLHFLERIPSTHLACGSLTREIANGDKIIVEGRSYVVEISATYFNLRQIDPPPAPAPQQ